jgi:transposase
LGCFLWEIKRETSSVLMKKRSEDKQIDSISEYDKLLKENERLHAENDYLKKLRALIQKKETQKKD